MTMSVLKTAVSLNTVVSILIYPINVMTKMFAQVTRAFRRKKMCKGHQWIFSNVSTASVTSFIEDSRVIQKYMKDPILVIANVWSPRAALDAIVQARRSETGERVGWWSER